MTIKTTNLTHRPRVSITRFSFCWWRHNRLLMTSKWPDNCDAIKWIMTANLLDIDFIHGHIHGRSCKKCKASAIYITPASDHYSVVVMGVMVSQITSLTIVYSTVYSGADQWKHQSSASLAFVQGIHRLPLNSLYKRPITWKMFPFDDAIMICDICGDVCR